MANHSHWRAAGRCAYEVQEGLAHQLQMICVALNVVSGPSFARVQLKRALCRFFYERVHQRL